MAVALAVPPKRSTSGKRLNAEPIILIVKPSSGRGASPGALPFRRAKGNCMYLPWTSYP
jgi:hypothetical protein